MGDGLLSFLQLDRHNIKAEDVVRTYLGCAPDEIHQKVIITPTWGVRILEGHVESIVTVFEGFSSAVWEVQYAGERISIIRSGMGAPFAGDTVLALSCTPCETLLFAGSAGGLVSAMQIGDLLIAQESVCGDGFCRYLEPEIAPRDCFHDTITPDADLTRRLTQVATEISSEHSIPLHSGKIFSTSSILAQFFRADDLVQRCDCIGIEMETAATFKAAGLVGIKAGALLQISDVIPLGKSLFAGRTEEEMDELKRIRDAILPKILLESIVD